MQVTKRSGPSTAPCGSPYVSFAFLSFTRFKHSIIVAKFASYSLRKLPDAKDHSLFVGHFARCSLQKLLVANNNSVFVVKFACNLLQKLLVAENLLDTHCKILSLLTAEVARYYKPFIKSTKTQL